MSSIPDSGPKTLPMVDIAHATDQSRVQKAEDVQEAQPYWPQGLPHIRHWSLNTGVMPPLHRFTLLAFSCHAGEDGKCDPSQGTIARLTGNTRQTVSEHVRFLVQIGEMETTPIITDQGLRYEYLLTGLYHDWVPTPKDPNQKPTVLGSLSARIDDLAARLASLQEENARKDEEIGRMGRTGDADTLRGDVGIPDNGLSETPTQRVVVVVVPENDPDTIETLDTTTTTTMGGVKNNPNNPPQVSRFQRVSDFLYREDVWARLGWSRDNPGGWKDRTRAVNWYLAHFDEAPHNRLSFLEQEYLYSREAELEAQAEAERQRELEDYAARGAQVISFDREAETVWEEVKEVFKNDVALRIPKPMFETWIRPTKGVSMDAGVFVVGAPTRYAVEWLERRQYHAIATIVGKVTGRPLEIEFTVFGDGTPEEEE